MKKSQLELLIAIYNQGTKIQPASRIARENAWAASSESNCSGVFSVSPVSQLGKDTTDSIFKKQQRDNGTIIWSKSKSGQGNKNNWVWKKLISSWL